MHEMLLVFNKLMEGMLRNDMKDKNVQGFSFSEYNQALLSFGTLALLKLIYKCSASLRNRICVLQ